MNASRAETETPGINLLPLFPEDMEVDVWSVNYRGFGGSTGEATLASFSSTATDVFDALHQEIGNDPILISGSSIGTLAALYLTTVRPSQGLILRNPVPLRELILKTYGSWALAIVEKDIPTSLNSIANAGQSKTPVLFLTSEKDETVSPTLQNLIFEKYAGDKKQVIMKGIKHTEEIPQSAYADIRQAMQSIFFH
jgi:pimeloyl-ACP methyl ester carboxylesterase